MSSSSVVAVAVPEVVVVHVDMGEGRELPVKVLNKGYDRRPLSAYALKKRAKAIARQELGLGGRR